MSSLNVREPSKAGPFKAKEVRLSCPHCHGSVFVPLPWRVTAEKRVRLVQAAVAEHRRLCPQAPADSGFVYSIDYPRT